MNDSKCPKCVLETSGVCPPAPMPPEYYVEEQNFGHEPQGAVGVITEVLKLRHATTRNNILTNRTNFRESNDYETRRFPCDRSSLPSSPIIMQRVHEEASASDNDKSTSDDGGAADEGLAVAILVNGTEQNNQIYKATKYEPPISKPPFYKNRSVVILSSVALFLIGCLVTLIIMYLTKLPKGGPMVGVDIPQPFSERDVAVMDVIETNVLQRNATFDRLQVRGATDSLTAALEWILWSDGAQIQPDDSKLRQRYVLALLAFSFDSLAWVDCGNPDYAAGICAIEGETGVIDHHSVWLSSTEECGWYGVSCINGVVVSLDLSGNDLIGEIPPEISQLQSLRGLFLNDNCIYGTIPPETGILRNLSELNLGNNGLSGNFPEALYEVTSLIHLDVGNQVGSERLCNRSSDGSLVHMKYKRGDPQNGENLGLQGEILGSRIGKLEHLESLIVRENYFSGSIDGKEIQKLKDLVFLRADGNALIGSIPSGIAALENLRELNLGFNYLTGGLPLRIGNMTSLQEIILSWNPLNGTLPDSIYELKKLKTLIIGQTLSCDESYPCPINDDVGLVGTLSKDVGNLENLEILMLSNNPLRGSVPTEMGLCEKLSIIHIDGTGIQGSIPEEVCNLRAVKLDGQSAPYGFQEFLKADCLPDNETQESFIVCDCCSTCCDHTTGQCENF